MSNKKGKSKGASADGDSGEASGGGGGGKGGTAVKVMKNQYSLFLLEDFFLFPLRFDIFYVKNNPKLWKHWKRSMAE